MEIYVVVGFREDGSLVTHLVADYYAQRRNIPEVRSYTNLSVAKSFRTRAVNLRDKGDYAGRRANQEAVDIRIAKISFGATDLEWVE
ncbi:hypothetical protein Wildcat_82 [Mycobacterium phage Wildcat]|uniref:Uncharacterized protein n=4 Tax=Mycobacterium virus Wildcat TaxID=1993859 RepID=Q19XX8_9CAUD|nr:hypothetical protein Wildcat_82 [Mycobacterium phage Wildcat]AJD82154.1 hypothetical protein COSMO_82 [Mycobacterium phage Cosmo]AQT25752.1 hypothetical protein EniyanLRS_78 [Mycobacterium phage EniyanLRS]QGJ89969.1 hypothetical protein PBI_MARYV_82 [Mycobacterium phage MaryV]WKR36092.1 hypothetical protein [Mycobacterium phage Azrael100]ABE67687.1 hypothetical protein Wildcat_82 [Mycobacterium phage Wildcat]